MRSTRIVWGIAFFFIFCFSFQVKAAIITVNTVSDNPADPGCSLREAITNANDNALTYPDCLIGGEPNSIIDEIHFQIPGLGPHTISPNSSLPAVMGKTFIDGTTQPLNDGTNQTASCDPRNLLIELDGSLMPAASTSSGLYLKDTSSGSIIRGLTINRFPAGGIYSFLGENYLIECNHIGTDVEGNVALPNSILPFTATGGITLYGTKSVIIGGPTKNKLNVISGNTFNGILIVGGEMGHVIQGNHIGTNLNGDAYLPNQYSGIYITNQFYENPGMLLIGGPLSGEGNIIAGNKRSGVTIYCASGQACATAKVSILSNIFVDNEEIGIDLKNDGVTVNDLGDGDAGPNGLLNYPEILSVEVDTNSFLITFKVDVNTSVTNKFRADFYANPSGPDPSGHGEGEIYLISDNITASPGAVYQVGAGNQPGINLNDIQFVSATLTEILPNGATGATSEFSKVKMVEGQIDFGDAPDPVNGTSAGNYNTRQADFGASHVLDESVYLGWCVDGDSGELQNVPASADDLTSGVTFGVCAHEGDDEDAIHFLNPIVSGQSVTIKFKTTGSGFFNGWIDWNQDGDWLDKYENIFQGVSLTEGIHTLTFTAPSVPQMTTYARFRYFKENLGYGNFRPIGHSQGGEVEDYQVKVYQQNLESKSKKWTPTNSEGRR